MKYLLVLGILFIGAMVLEFWPEHTSSVSVKPPYNGTRIPYNNGFYAGPYNSKLPVIDPSKKD